MVSIVPLNKVITRCAALKALKLFVGCPATGVPADDGAGNRLHDWNDFAITDGVLYNFDGAGTLQAGKDDTAPGLIVSATPKEGLSEISLIITNAG